MRLVSIKLVRLCSVCDTPADYQCVVCGKNFCTRDGCPRQRTSQVHHCVRLDEPTEEPEASATSWARRLLSPRLEPAAFPVRLPDIPSVVILASRFQRCYVRGEMMIRAERKDEILALIRSAPKEKWRYSMHHRYMLAYLDGRGFQIAVHAIREDLVGISVPESDGASAWMTCKVAEISSIP